MNSRLEAQVEPLKKGLSVSRFTDRIISPTWVDNFAEAMLEIVEDSFDYRGILHLAGSQSLTDYEYTCYLARYLRVAETLVKKDKLQISSLKTWNISLDVSFTQSLLRTRLLNVEEQLARIFPA